MKAALVLFSLLVSGSLAAESTCKSVAFNTWANATLLRTEDLATPVNIVVVTHTETVSCDTDADCERLASNIRNNHIKEGKTDIALSFLVGGNGKVYEGAGWKAGGHTYGYNDKSISVSFIGTFHNNAPSAAMLEASENFLGCLLNTRYVGCEYSLVGHRQLSLTSSPGDALQSIIETWPHWTSDVSNL